MPPHNILLIPLDSRPVNTQYAEMLGAIGKARSPACLPAELLDNYLKPAATGEMMDWLEKNSARADKIIIFANELFNGGLIASRDPASYREIEKRLDRFEEYLRMNAPQDITVLYILPRHLPSQFTTLWAYRDELTRWGEISDRLGRDNINEDEKARLRAELSLLQKDIPPAVLDGYIGLYAAARALGERLMALAADDWIDQLVIGLDDAAPYGLSMQLFNTL